MASQNIEDQVIDNLREAREEWEQHNSPLRDDPYLQIRLDAIEEALLALARTIVRMADKA